MAKNLKYNSNTDFEDNFFEKCLKKPIPVECSQIPHGFEVETLEGTMKGKAGDYLMRGIDGELYPCAKNIFDKSYDILTSKPGIVEAAEQLSSKLKNNRINLKFNCTEQELFGNLNKLLKAGWNIEDASLAYGLPGSYFILCNRDQQQEKLP